MQTGSTPGFNTPKMCAQARCRHLDFFNPVTRSTRNPGREEAKSKRKAINLIQN